MNQATWPGVYLLCLLADGREDLLLPRWVPPKGSSSSVVSFVFEKASLTAVTAAQLEDEDGWTDTALRVIQATQVVRILERVP